MKIRLKNREIERMAYLRKIQKTILNHLYQHVEEKLEKCMWLIAEENQVLIKGSSPTFFFNGRWWPTDGRDYPKGCNKVLHSSLYSRVQEIIDSLDLKNDTIKIGVETVIGNFLSISGHVKDIERLFPESIQSFIPTLDSEVFNIKDPLSDDIIKELITKNKINLKYLKRLLMTQVLLAKVT